MPVQVSNPTNVPLIFQINGGAWLFPPVASKSFWTWREEPAGPGESPFKVEEHKEPVKGSVRGVRSVPDHVAQALQHGSYRGRGADKLIIGNKAEAALQKNMDDNAAQVADQAAEIIRLKNELQGMKMRAGWSKDHPAKKGEDKAEEAAPSEKK